MIRVDVEQGTPEWLKLRLGIPTASAFDRVMTPKKLQLSSQAPKYRNQLLSEWLVGHPLDWADSSDFMARGRAMEPRARAWYELQHDVEVAPGGFVLRDDGMVGGSPDGWVGEDGGVEFKVPAMDTHVGYLTEPGTLAEKYINQVQGLLLLTGRDWWDIVSYHPDLPAVEVRVLPDRHYHTALSAALDQFVEKLLEGRRELEKYRLVTDAAPAAWEVMAHA